MFLLSRDYELLVWAVFTQVAAIYLFAGGLLATKIPLPEPNINTNKESHYAPEPTHSRAVLLIIDSLRFDFLSPDPPDPPSSFHHDILTVPNRLTQQQPQKSFLFDAYADPPTMTVLRIKSLMTGTLPMFGDLGGHGSASSPTENSIVKQLRIQGKTIAFMGDDTWTSVFPGAFDPNMTFPFDGYNVEDLHTVDDGVVDNLFPLLLGESKPFDFLIGHFLGVDHVGHRIGPNHAWMKMKLKQMDTILERVVDELDEDTLLVVMGDHGMTRSGDHGGHGELETSSALWVYSKGRELQLTRGAAPGIPSSLLDYKIFPGSQKAHRRVQQIDIVPTMALLLGLPIPFHNLGSVIPELFDRGDNLSLALSVNTAQIRSYVDAYRASPLGNRLDETWPELERAWKASNTLEEVGLSVMYKVNRQVLSTFRSQGAEFRIWRMAMGVVLLGLELFAMGCIYLKISTSQVIESTCFDIRLYGLIIGFILGSIVQNIVKSYAIDIGSADCIVFFTVVGTCLPSIVTSFPSSSSWLKWRDVPLSLLFHSASLLSGSLTIWEDRIIPFVLLWSMIPSISKAFTAPTLRLRRRIQGFSLLFTFCVCLIANSTVCREEQRPNCQVTYYTSDSLPTPPLLIRILSFPTACAIPLIMQNFLRISRLDASMTNFFLLYVLRLALMAASVSWLAEWLETEQTSNGWLVSEMVASQALRTARSLLGGIAFAGISVLGTALWWFIPVSSEILQPAHPKVEPVSKKSEDVLGSRRKILVIGFRITSGSSYFLFWCIPFSMVYASTQLTGQIALGLSAVALLAYLEIVDNTREALILKERLRSSDFPNSPGISSQISSPVVSQPSPQITFSEVVPVALLGLQAFYATGHHATISSLQSKSGFVLTKDVVYPFSHMTLLLNTFGPLMLAGFAAPLLAVWNLSPFSLPTDPSVSDIMKGGGVYHQPDARIRRESVLAALGTMMYYGYLLLGSALSTAIHRRHPMLWQVFALRYLVAVASVCVVDFGVLVGMGVGVERIVRAVNRTIDSEMRKSRVR